jgi:hypothetical protein
MPARTLPRSTAPSGRPDRRAVRKIRQALLRPLRGYLFAQVFASRLDRRCLLRHVISAPPLSRLPRAPPAQERALGPFAWCRRDCLRGRRDRRRSAPSWAPARRAGGGRRGSRGCHQHCCGRATRRAVSPTYLWLPSE